MRTPEPTPIPPMPPVPVEDGELIPPATVYPSPLPLDPLPDVLAATGMLAHPLIVAAVGFAIVALALAFLAAWSYSRSALGAPRYRREARGGEPSTPEVSGSPFPNLFRK